VATGAPPHCTVTARGDRRSGTPSDSNFIASSTAQPGSCGAESSPWVVEAGRGQKLRFTLHDFSVQPAAAG